MLDTHGSTSLASRKKYQVTPAVLFVQRIYVQAIGPRVQYSLHRAPTITSGSLLNLSSCAFYIGGYSSCLDAEISVLFRIRSCSTMNDFYANLETSTDVDLYFKWKGMYIFGKNLLMFAE